MKKKIMMIAAFVLVMIGFYALYRFNYIPHRKYTNADFNIETYKSHTDKDHDGIDDQTDILNNAKNYIKTKPKYKSKYYNTGYPNDGYGVCTDVVAFALKDAGYDLMTLVNEDIEANKKLYDIEMRDNMINVRGSRRPKGFRGFSVEIIWLKITENSRINEWRMLELDFK